MDRAIDFSLQVRKGVVKHLIADAPLTALVSASRIWGETPAADLSTHDEDGTPKWPFIKMGFQLGLGWSATCLSGSQHTLSIDAFVRGDPFSDSALRVAATVVKAMQSLSLPTLDLRDLQWTGTQQLREGVRDWHMVIGYSLIATQTE